MNTEYLVAAPVLALAGEGLIRRGERGEVQAAGAALIGLGVISLIFGFTAAAVPSSIGSLVWLITPLVYLGAFAAAVVAALARKWPRRAICWLAFGGIAIPSLWALLLTGSILDFFTVASYAVTAADRSYLYDFFWLTAWLAGFIAVPAAPGMVLVWRQSRQSSFWWLGAALIGLGGMKLLIEILVTVDFWLAGPPV